MEPKSKEEIAEDKKLAIGRNMISLRHRLEQIDERNALEAAIKQSHMEEVNNGTVSVPEVPSLEDVIGWLAPNQSSALQEGDIPEITE